MIRDTDSPPQATQRIQRRRSTATRLQQHLLKNKNTIVQARGDGEAPKAGGQLALGEATKNLVDIEA